MAGARALEPPRDLHPQTRLQGQIVDLQQRVTLLERDAPEAVHYVGAAGEPTFQNSWIHYDNSSATPSATPSHRNVGFYSDRSRVYLEGVCKNGTTTAGTAIFTLPVAYRPAKQKIFPLISGAVFGWITVETSGAVAVQVAASGYLCLDPVSFRL